MCLIFSEPFVNLIFQVRKLSIQIIVTYFLFSVKLSVKEVLLNIFEEIAQVVQKYNIF